ncbi:lipase family protein [Nocardia sp. NPDC058666]|uniref:lipase family protein n=1 Tax=Nocardia sp. NPDC058666 TaxID=3346587 RepID=UPI00366614C4
MRRGALIVAAVFAVTVTPAFAQPLPSEQQVYDLLPLQNPRDDAWYSAPDNLGELSNGQIVRTRDIQSYALGIPIPVAARQILYRSSDSRGRPLVTATTVLIPGIPWVGSPRPLVSFQEAIDSLAPVCNPSYTLRAGTFKEIAVIQYFLEQGMAVSIPDFDGQHNFWLTPAEGHMVLDGLRAARSDPTLGLADSGIGLYGYSGGGSASTWAAELHATYAPELPILGVAAGGVPSEKRAIVEVGVRRELNLTSWGVWTMLLALSREFPDVVNLNELVNDEGLEILRDLEDRCVYTIGATGTLKQVVNYLKDPAALQDPRLIALLDETTPGRDGTPPRMPLLMWHSTTDEILPYESTVGPLVDRYCRTGADLRYLPIPLSEHFLAAVTGIPAAMGWLSLQVRGGPILPRTC